MKIEIHFSTRYKHGFWENFWEVREESGLVDSGHGESLDEALDAFETNAHEWVGARK